MPLGRRPAARRNASPPSRAAAARRSCCSFTRLVGRRWRDSRADRTRHTSRYRRSPRRAARRRDRGRLPPGASAASGAALISALSGTPCPFGGDRLGERPGRHDQHRLGRRAHGLAVEQDAKAALARLDAGLLVEALHRGAGLHAGRPARQEQAQRCWLRCGPGVCAGGRAAAGACPTTAPASAPAGRAAGPRRAAPRTAQGLTPAWRAACAICATRLGTAPPPTSSLARLGSSALAVGLPAAALDAQRRGQRRVLIVARLGRQDELPAFGAQMEIAAAHHGRRAACRRPGGAGWRRRRSRSKRPAMQLNGTPASVPPSSRCVSAGQLASWLARPQSLGDGDVDRAAGRIQRIARRAAAAAQAQVDVADRVAQARDRSRAGSRARRATRDWPWPSASPARSRPVGS